MYIFTIFDTPFSLLNFLIFKFGSIVLVAELKWNEARQIYSKSYFFYGHFKHSIMKILQHSDRCSIFMCYILYPVCKQVRKKNEKALQQLSALFLKGKHVCPCIGYMHLPSSWEKKEFHFTIHLQLNRALKANVLSLNNIDFREQGSN